MTQERSGTPRSPATGRGSDGVVRPKARDSQAALTALREVALREFVESGYHAVSIRDLAREASVTLSFLYHYYESKQDLLYQLLDETVDAFHRIYEQRTNAIGATGEPLSSFLILVDATVHYRALLPNQR
jgi:AcrR family transcriptional regulator